MRGSLLVAIVTLLCVLTVTQSAPLCKRVVGYYAYWAQYSGYYPGDVPFASLSHICHAFITPNSNGTLDVPVDYLANDTLNTAAHSVGVKVLVSVGGAGGSTNFPAVAASPTYRTEFANALEAFCRTNHYDGVDVDWEYPATIAERENYVLLVQAIRSKFDASASPAPTWLITMAIPPTDWYGQWFNFTGLTPYVDQYNMMAYDYHGAWNTISAHNAPLYYGYPDSADIASSTTYLTVTRGVPADKLNLGIPFYGRSWPTSEVLYDNCGGSCANAVAVNFKAIYPLIGNGWTRIWDVNSSVPYVTNDTGAGLISYDDAQSIAAKTVFAFNVSGFGGLMNWELSQDYWNGSQWILMAAMYDSTVGYCYGEVTTTSTTETPGIIYDQDTDCCMNSLSGREICDSNCTEPDISYSCTHIGRYIEQQYPLANPGCIVTRINSMACGEPCIMYFQGNCTMNITTFKNSARTGLTSFSNGTEDPDAGIVYWYAAEFQFRLDTSTPLYLRVGESCVGFLQDEPATTTATSPPATVCKFDYLFSAELYNCRFGLYSAQI